MCDLCLQHWAWECAFERPTSQLCGTHLDALTKTIGLYFHAMGACVAVPQIQRRSIEEISIQKDER